MRSFIYAVIAVFAVFVFSCGEGSGNKIERGLPASEGDSANVPASGQVLSQIENLSAPDGVDKNVFDSLKRELIRQHGFLVCAIDSAGNYWYVADPFHVKQAGGSILGPGKSGSGLL